MMTSKYSPALSDYLPAFENNSCPFLYYYSFNKNNKIQRETFTRSDILSLANKAARVIKSRGLIKGDRFVLCFSANRYQDISVRLAAVMTGTTPVTINWQSDTLDQVLYKIKQTESKLVFTDTDYDMNIINKIKSTFARIPIVSIESINNEKELSENDYSMDIDEAFTRIIVFTSGTTGKPKGVQLPYRAYQTNRKTFEQFLEISSNHRFAVLIVNPMHHTNSTAITDWAMRRPRSDIHLIEKYTTNYWKIFHEVSERNYDSLAAPVVSRHMDFLEELDQKDKLPVNREKLISAMKKTDFLIGSAPVGPTTIKRFLTYTDKVPNVRFGSTETCLQVIGIPRYLSEDDKKNLFETGWHYHYEDEPQPGYYIGRPHPSYTEAKIVKSIDPTNDDFLIDCDYGEPGYLIAKGENLMSGYINNPSETKNVLQNQWYIGFKDICFALKNKTDGELDFFWVSRDSAMLIRGGTNYSYDQINSELESFIIHQYQLPKESFDLAVVGLKIDSEHEDACCVTIELKTDEAKQKKDKISETFLKIGKQKVSKGAKPDYVIFDKILRNFKGAVLIKELSKEFKQFLDLD
ncbi:MAG: acyl--CoA ligase [Deltaproteobacteria bacterium]|nr:acyl--CoA ligase [Deltaproteobacteria bacterium]